MNHSGDAAEQIVRMSLEGFDISARLVGSGAKNIAVLIYTIMQNKGQTKGKARLTNMLKSGKELKVFTVKQGDIKKFQEEAKKYGVLYCVLHERGNRDPAAIVDVMARAEDAPKINRIIERFNLASVDQAIITPSHTRTPSDLDFDVPVPQSQEGIPPIVNESEEQLAKEKTDNLLDDLFGSPPDQSKEAQSIEQKKLSETEKSPLSEPSFVKPKNSEKGTINAEKPSVREQLREIKAIRATKEETPLIKETTRQTNTPLAPQHKQPRKKKRKKQKGR